ncbi:Uncharacterised protein [Mycobacterium tuberculosis]|uniref:Uncharacterized protein n=1 Tax=Mycobacterium tuberculosis TaxID=1773 RepID=A0A916P991_MYCTX|nr:Uncharacterised protein [Mycobacterium tuberculosis]
MASSWPAINRIVCASDDGPAPSCTRAETTSWSNERGYTCPTLLKTVAKPKKSATRRSRSASAARSPPSRSSMS